MNRKVLNESEPIKAGTTLLEEKPFAFVLSSREKSLRCDFCFFKGKVLKCSGCQYAHYCGRACQKDAWREHKWECPSLKRISPKVIPDSARLMAKIINLLSNGDGNSRRGFYTQSNFRLWKDLMSHYSDLKEDKKRMEHFTSLCMVLFDFLADTYIPNSAELMGIFGRMCINSFHIVDTEMLSVGTGIYLGASVIDHSCVPNAVAIFDGTTISIRATTDLPCLDWSKITISYIELLKTPYERQMDLLNTYYFLCQCRRCLDLQNISFLHAAKCPSKDCDYPIQIQWKRDVQLFIKVDENNVSKSCEIAGNTNGTTYNNTNGLDHEIEAKKNYHSESGTNLHDEPFSCNKCNAPIDKSYIDKFINVMEFTETHLKDMRNTSTAYVDVCRLCLSKQEDLLHPLNIMHLETLELAFEACVDFENWELACKYAEALIPGFRFYHGERNPLVGLLLMKYGKILLYLSRCKEALAQLQKAEPILKITHGQKHTLYKEMLVTLLHQTISELKNNTNGY